MKTLMERKVQEVEEASESYTDNENQTFVIRIPQRERRPQAYLSDYGTTLAMYASNPTTAAEALQQEVWKDATQ